MQHVQDEYNLLFAQSFFFFLVLFFLVGSSFASSLSVRRQPLQGGLCKHSGSKDTIWQWARHPYGCVLKNSNFSSQAERWSPHGLFPRSEVGRLGGEKCWLWLFSSHFFRQRCTKNLSTNHSAMKSYCSIFIWIGKEIKKDIKSGINTDVLFQLCTFPK